MHRKFPFWSKVSSSKIAKDIAEIGHLAASGWKKEIAHSPKVFWYAICFGAGYHFYEAVIKPKISSQAEEDATGTIRRSARPRGK